jgi:hypothetical protein
MSLIDLLIMMVWDWRLRTAAITGLLFVPRVNVSGVRGDDDDAGWDNSWFVYQSSLAVLSAETSGASKRNGRGNENFAY